jgi:hypothetical protein
MHQHSAPMKALASEITRKLGKRLQWLSIRVRELTGNERQGALGFISADRHQQATCR